MNVVVIYKQSNYSSSKAPHLHNDAARFECLSVRMSVQIVKLDFLHLEPEQGPPARASLLNALYTL